jgi:spore maturation protein CgeB
MKLVVLGLSLSSSWGNGHATTYRALLKAFAARGHEVVFLERDMPWYSGDHRDLAEPNWCDLRLYADREELERHASTLATADAVMVGSYVPKGVEVGAWAQRTASGPVVFYDIDTPVTLAKLARGDFEYLSPELIPGYAVYFSFTGGPTLELLEHRYGSPAARALFCSVDAAVYRPVPSEPRWDLSYLGTYSDDRQPTLERLLIETARRAPELRFVVAGPQYPEHIDWPTNVERFQHVGPADHPAFYGFSRYTLNVTRADMIAAGWSPSVRLFEPGREITLAPDGADAAGAVLAALRAPEAMRRAQADAFRARVLAEHTAQHRAAQLEADLLDAVREQRSGQACYVDEEKRGNARSPAFGVA